MSTAAMLPSIVLLRKVIEQRGSCCVTVTGTSMLPGIAPASQVRIEHTAFQELQPGDVVAFAVAQNLFVHRVLERDSERLITCGDNKDLLDPPITADNYIARVVALQSPDGRSLPLPQVQRQLSWPGNLAHVQIWLFCRPERDLTPLLDLAAQWGATVHPVACATFGLAATPLAELREALPANALKIGVSDHAVQDIGTLAHISRDPRPLHLLIGCSFGNLERDGLYLLPPDIVDMHLRCGAPYTPTDPLATAAWVLGALTMLSHTNGGE